MISAPRDMKGKGPFNHLVEVGLCAGVSGRDMAEDLVSARADLRWPRDGAVQ